MQENVVTDEATRTEEALSITLLSRELESLVVRKANCRQQIADYKAKQVDLVSTLHTMELAEKDLRTAIDQLIKSNLKKGV